MNNETNERSTGDVERSDAFRELHDRYTSLEHSVQEAVQDLRLGRNRDDVAVELQMALEKPDDPSTTTLDRSEVSE